MISEKIVQLLDQLLPEGNWNKKKFNICFTLVSMCEFLKVQDFLAFTDPEVLMILLNYTMEIANILW